MREKMVKESLKKYLKSIGAYYFMPVQMGYGSCTIDFLICHSGRFFGIETKQEGIDEPTPRQALVMSAIIAAGGHAWIENSVGLEKTRELLPIGSRLGHWEGGSMEDGPNVWVWDR